MTQKRNPTPGALSTADSQGIVDLELWKQQKAQERKRCCKPFGWAYTKEAEPYWRASYDAERIERILRAYEIPSKKDEAKDVLYTLSPEERAALGWLVHWHDRRGHEAASPAAIARVCGVRRATIHPILLRLGQARMIVNLGKPRAQDLAINGRVVEWNLPLIRSLRNAEYSRMIKRLRWR